MTLIMNKFIFIAIARNYMVMLKDNAVVPWMISVEVKQDGTKQKCAATLITKHWAILDAKCITDSSKVS